MTLCLVGDLRPRGEDLVFAMWVCFSLLVLVSLMVLAMVGGSKSAIFKLRNRLDIVRRKKKAVVGYLKRDIAELLEAGHDENAYGRVCFFFISFVLLRT